jgi:DNA-binding beta-propeller fold protein YncE
MVQLLLTRLQPRRLAALLACALLLMGGAYASGRGSKASPVVAPPDLLLEGGRKLSFVRTFGSERDTRGKLGFWNKVLDVVAGEPDYRHVIRPYGVAVDSRGRVIVADPGAEGIHIFDFEQHKYKFLERREKSKDPIHTPQCVAVDAQDNIYVTDSEAGKIFVFDSKDNFRRSIGGLRGGEGYFKRPTGIAVDSKAGRIYVTDTLRDQIFVLDMAGSVLAKIGKHGSEPGELYYPTELRLLPDGILVVDSMNFRLQIFGLDGTLQTTIGHAGEDLGELFRPKGVGVDSEGHIYIVDGLSGVVQVFNREGQLLYYFGGRGAGLGEFQLPTGLVIDRNDRIYILDSFNSRVQVFQYDGIMKADGAKK